MYMDMQKVLMMRTALGMEQVRMQMMVVQLMVWMVTLMVLMEAKETELCSCN